MFYFGLLLFFGQKQLYFDADILQLKKLQLIRKNIDISNDCSSFVIFYSKFPLYSLDLLDLLPYGFW